MTPCATETTMMTVPCRVERVVRETSDTFTLDLKPPSGASREGARGFSFAPGQFNMLYVFGAGEIPISISGDPDRPDQLIHTTRAVGVVTKAMRNLKPGDQLGVRGPYGSAWPVERARGHDVVIVAGGIGLAPLRPAIYRILARRGEFGKVVLLYGARTQEDILFKKELSRWAGRFDIDVYVTVDRATANWRGNVGVVTTLIKKAPYDPFDAMAMVCGPEVMMRYAVQELLKRGLAERNVHLSMERNMKCGVGLCGHCQCGPVFICREGPVFPYERVRDFFGMREV